LLIEIREDTTRFSGVESQFQPICVVTTLQFAVSIASAWNVILNWSAQVGFPRAGNRNCVDQEEPVG